MPHENIYATSFGDSPDVKSNRIEVHWMPDRNVDLGVSIPPGEHGAAEENVTIVRRLFASSSADIGKAIYDRLNVPRYDAKTSELEHEQNVKMGAMVLEILDEVYPCAGIWAPLDRPSVNRLIRILRRARDSAFGKDE